MAENNNDTRITDGKGTRIPDIGQVILKLDSTLGSFTSQINTLTKAMQENQKQLSSITNSNEKFYREFSKNSKTDFPRRGSRGFDSGIGNLRTLGSLASDIEEFRKELSNATKQIKGESRSWRYSNKSFKGAGADLVSSRRRQEVLDNFMDALDKYRQDLEIRLRQENSLYSDMMKKLSTEFDFNKYKKDVDELKSKRTSLVESRKMAQTPEEKRALTEQIKLIQQQLTKTQSEGLPYVSKMNSARRQHAQNISTIQEDISSQISELTRKKDNLINQIENVFSDIEQAFERAQEGVDLVRGRSLSLDKYMEKLEASKEEKFNDAVEQAREQISDSMSVLEKKLKDDAELTDERLKLTDDEKENIKKQLEILKKEDAYLRKLTPLTDIWKDAGNKIQDTLRDGLLGMIDPFVKNLEDRYLNSYIEGFQNVYNSIESTRNSISARLKLNSGDYKEMQEALYGEIQARGLAGSVSMTDVDDMLVSLQSAGITDQTMLQELAIQGAKLKAQGSSLDLGNEETLQQIMQLYGQSMRKGATSQEALGSISSMIEQIAGGEGAIRKEFGYDAALVNGGMNTIFNQAMKMGLATGKGSEQLASDVISSAYGSQALYGSGVDESLIRQTVQSIFEGTVSDTDVFGKMLIGSEDFQARLREGMDMSQAMDYVMNNMQSILAGADSRYIAEIGKAYGLPGTVTDWLNVQQRDGAFSVTPSDSFQDNIDSMIEADNKAIEQGDYLSKTAQVNKQAENKMTKQAIEAEQLYKGDQLVVAELQAISGIVNNIYGIIKQGAMSSLESLGKGGLEAFGRKGVSSMLGESGWAGDTSLKEGAGQFLTGKSGTALGAAGTAAGVAVGAYWMVDAIKEGIDHPLQELGSDPEFYRGLGTTLGAAAGGPIGAAVGGLIGQVASQLGNMTYKNIIAEMDVYDEQMEAADRLKQAAEDLTESANKQQEEINKAQQNIVDQKEIFNNYDENMQKQFVAQMNIDSTGMSNQEAFQKAIEKWEQIELQKIAEMELKKRAQESTTLLSASMDKQVTGSLFEASADVQKQEIAELVEAGMLDPSILEKVNKHGTTFLSKSSKNAIDEAWKKKQEQAVDLRAMATDQGYSELALIEEQALRDYAQANGMFDATGSVDLDNVRKTMQTKGVSLNYEKAIKNLYGEAIKEGSMSAEDVSMMAQNASLLSQNQQAWESSNAQFQARWDDIQKENPGASVMDLVTAYNKKYLDGKGISVADVIDGFFVDSNGLYAEYTMGEGGKPMLRSTSRSGGRKYDPAIYEGKFETGLTAVPFDMYPALLHEGERVLTKQEADAYNELSSYAVSQIANETTNRFAKNTNYFSSSTAGMDVLNGNILDQTKKEEQLLGQILEAIMVLVKETRALKGKSSGINSNVLNMNTNLTSLNTKI